MGKFTKWIAGGLGWTFFGPLGGLLGFVLGSFVEKTDTESPVKKSEGKTTTGDFAISLLVLVAAVMKADGKVLRSELDYVKSYFVHTFGESAAGEAIILLRDILKQHIDIKAVSTQIKSRLDYPSRLQMLHFLYGIANADGQLGPDELNILQVIAGYIGISNKDTESIQAMFVIETDGAYKVLEIEPSATVEEIKKAYRQMALKYHPDKVAYLGEDIKKAATEKFQMLNESYEIIKKERGFV